jgi:hypothetical protein
MTYAYISHPLRQQLDEVALQWERSYSVLPRVGDALSEFDAAMFAGHTPETFSKAMAGTTAVQKGFGLTGQKNISLNEMQKGQSLL